MLTPRALPATVPSSASLLLLLALLPLVAPACVQAAVFTMNIHSCLRTPDHTCVQATAIGGYLLFGKDTKGDILSNFSGERFDTALAPVV